MGTQNYEQLINIYGNINTYCMIAAFVFLALSVFLFFWLKIPQVFGELTGRTAQKAIDEMLAQNGDSGSLTSMKVGHDGRRRRKGRTGFLGTGKLRMNTGSLSRKMTGDITGEITSQMSNPVPNVPDSQTEYVSTYGGSAPTDVLDSYGSQPTDVLDNYGSQPTDVLSNTENTNVQNTDIVYQQPESETMVLSPNVMNSNKGFIFIIERSIEEIHTDEVI